MSIWYILLIMLFCHIIADYNLQGFLAEAKQKSFWEKYGAKYKNDYIIALLEHSFSWTFLIMLPLMYFGYILNFMPLFITNCLIHFYVDDLKANQHKINLIQDQLCHFMQIFITWVIAVMI